MLFAVGSNVAAGEVTLPSEAIATVRAYSAAITRADCASAWRMLSPALRKSVEAQRGSKQFFCDFLRELKQERVVEEIGAPGALRAQGRFRIAIIPTLRTALGATRLSYPTEGAYVLHSDDSGLTWYVLDLACVDERWLKKVYPPYDGSPPVPTTRARLPDQK